MATIMNKYYDTSDLSLASFLSLYFPIDYLNKTNPEKVIFCFLRSEELENLIEAFWRRKVQVNPQDYFAAIKNVKSRLYQDY
jgi:hypothetical protein